MINRFRRPRHRGVSGVVIGGILLLAAAAVADSVDADGTPDDTRGVVGGFGFEERTTADWSHAFEQAPGMPRRGLFFDVSTDETVRRDGRASIRFDLEGGSISYRTRDEASIPVEPEAEYRVTGWIRSQGLEHARARIEVRLVDGRRLDLLRDAGTSKDPVAEATRSLHVAAPTIFEKGWDGVRIDIDTGSPESEGIRDPRLFLSLQVVQPGFDRRDADEAVGRVPRVEVQDVGGSAWFDSVQVVRAPRVRLDCLVPGRVAAIDEPIPFRVHIDDGEGRRRAARLELRDLDGRLIDHVEVDAGPGPGAEPIFRPGRPGWYEASLRVEGESTTEAVRVPVLVVARDEAWRDHGIPRLGLSVANWSTEELDSLSRSLDHLDPAVLELSMWPAGMDDQASLEGLEPMRRLLDRQRFASREVVIAIDRLHGRLAAMAGVEPGSVLAALLDDPEEIWDRAIGDWMAGLGTTISRWRFAGGPGGLSTPASLRKLADRHVADPTILVSSSARRRVDRGADESYLEVDRRSTADTLREIDAERLRGSTVRVASPPSDWSHRDRVAAASRLVLGAWERGVDRILHEWESENGPDPAVLAWTGLSPALGGRRMAGEIPAGETARCIVASGTGGSVLVAYSDRAEGAETIRIPVGDRTVELVDIQGRRSIAASDAGMLELVIDGLPVQVHGVDPTTIGVASSIRFEPSVLAVSRREHAVELVLSNVGDTDLAGEIELELPSGWVATPPIPAFRAGPFETARIPVVIRWNGSQRVGERRLQGVVVLQDGRRSPIEVEVPIELRSDSIEVAADWTIARGSDPGASPIVVEIEIENIGDRTIDLEIDASAWRVGRETRLVSGLRPGERRVKRVRMKAGVDRLAGTDIRIELRELDGEEGLVVDLPIVGGRDPGSSPIESATATTADGP